MSKPNVRFIAYSAMMDGDDYPRIAMEIAPAASESRGKLLIAHNIADEEDEDYLLEYYGCNCGEEDCSLEKEGGEDDNLRYATESYVDYLVSDKLGEINYDSVSNGGVRDGYAIHFTDANNIEPEIELKGVPEW